MTIRVLSFSGFYLPGYRGGGPIRTIANMVDAVGDGFKFRVITSDRDLGATSAYPDVNLDGWNSQENAEVFYVPRGLVGIMKMMKILQEKNFDVISLNSFFSFQFGIIPLLAAGIFCRGVPIVLGPRGEFSSGALEIKKLKKTIFLFFSKIIGLQRGVIWHASSDYEASDIRRVVGTYARIRVAVDIAKPSKSVEIGVRILGAPLRVIFISRISRKKNLLGAIEMLRGVSRSIVFDVYGPGEDAAYLKQCAAAAESLPKNIFFRYCGELHSDHVALQLAKYDLFFFPTFGENFGHVIAEALFAGLPLLVSDTTPWRELEKKALGWDLPLRDPHEFVARIEECWDMSPQKYTIWRQGIRDWAVENIGRNEAVEQNKKLFIDLK